MTSHTAEGYRIVVGGHLPDHWSVWFSNLTLAREHDGTTSLSGAVPDQAALHGLLTRIRDLGLVLVSVEPLTPTPPPN